MNPDSYLDEELRIFDIKEPLIFDFKFIVQSFLDSTIELVD